MQTTICAAARRRPPPPPLWRSHLVGGARVQSLCRDGAGSVENGGREEGAVMDTRGEGCVDNIRRRFTIRNMKPSLVACSTTSTMVTIDTTSGARRECAAERHEELTTRRPSLRTVPLRGSGAHLAKPSVCDRWGGSWTLGRGAAEDAPAQMPQPMSPPRRGTAHRPCDPAQPES